MNLHVATVALLSMVGCQPGAFGPGSSNMTSSNATSSNVTSGDANGGDSAVTAVERPKMKDKFELTDEEWRQRLTPDQYYVLRQKGTERPFDNEFDEHFEAGTYACAACGQELFTSKAKFNSGCGWPAFYAAKAEDRVKLTPDRSHGMVRTEVTCARCDSHLGHIFDDAPQTPTGQRYCINSVSLKFVPAASQGD
jgi:peptide-methionine (R)-S-oxide reductase